MTASEFRRLQPLAAINTVWFEFGGAMSILDSLKAALPVGESSPDITEYECQECGNRFESAKVPDRAQCMDCLSRNVEVVDDQAQ